jgi:hypothetical protein
MFTSQAPTFTQDEIQATEALAAIELTQLHINAVMWRDHRRQSPTYTAVLIADINKTGEYFCYAGDAIRVARCAGLKTHHSIFGGKKVETLSFPASEVVNVLQSLHGRNLNALFLN